MKLNQKGLTLMEVLATLVIIGIVFTLLIQSTGFLTTATSLHDHQKEATQIGERILNEALVNLKEGKPHGVPGSINGYTVGVSTAPLSTPPAPVSSGHYIALSGVYSEGTLPKIITITVSWEN